MTDPREAFDLSGRVAVITGAASGIGEASARMLAGAGAAVVCADLNVEGAKRVADAIRADGGVASAVACDVSVREDVDALVQQAVDEHGHIDDTANMAGTIQESQVVDTR